MKPLAVVNTETLEQEFKFDPSAVSIAHDVEISDDSYTIMFINMTSKKCYTHVLTKNIGDADWNSIAIDKVCPNCSDDYDTCVDKKKYIPIMTLSTCNPPIFELVVAFIDGENYKGVKFLIEPDCKYDGVIVAARD